MYFWATAIWWNSSSTRSRISGVMPSRRAISAVRISTSSSSRLLKIWAQASGPRVTIITAALTRPETPAPADPAVASSFTPALPFASLAISVLGRSLLFLAAASIVLNFLLVEPSFYQVGDIDGLGTGHEFHALQDIPLLLHVLGDFLVFGFQVQPGVLGHGRIHGGGQV